jgi:metal-sulfur cluster biosynthetic enzyme
MSCPLGSRRRCAGLAGHDYDVAIEDGRVRIVMTLTAPGCPIHDARSEWIERAARAVPGVEAVNVVITFDPPWTPDRITASPPR